MLFSYRNHSIDMLCKSINWFLYEGKTGLKWVNLTFEISEEILIIQLELINIQDRLSIADSYISLDCQDLEIDVIKRFVNLKH